MRTFFFSLALGAGLVFTSPGVAVDGPKEPACPTLIESMAPAPGVVSVSPNEPLEVDAPPVSRLRQWLVSGAVICTTGGGGYVACRLLYDNHDVRTAFAGAALAVGIGQLIAVLRMMVAPQADFSEKWLARTFYAVNHSVLQWFLNRQSRLGALGDRFSPNLNADIRGRQDENQQHTAEKIGSVVTHLDWLGLRLPQMLKDGEIDLAADQLVSTVVLLSYDSQEIIVRTREPHVDPMTQQLVMLAAESYLFKKLAALFNANPGLVAQFNASVQRALNEQSIKHPQPFIAYRAGTEIVLNGWMADAVREMCNAEFCVKLPQ
jgi:hypothetical protein